MDDAGAGIAYSGRFDPRRCVVLVPYYGSIEAECDEGLRALERRGYAVRRVGGNAAIDQARSQMATDALADGFEETLWIDADIVFDPDSVDRLRTHPHGIIGGLYARKNAPGFACSMLPGTRSIGFGEHGGLVEVLYLGTGFLLVRRAVYLAIQEKFKLPVCNEQFGKALVPFFQPLVREVGEGESACASGDLRSGGGGSVGDRPQRGEAASSCNARGTVPFFRTTSRSEGEPEPEKWDSPRPATAHWYLGEDYAFCHRARECGYKIYADTTIRLWHIGRQSYTWEDAAAKRQQSAAFDFTIVDSSRVVAEGGGGDLRSDAGGSVGDRPQPGGDRPQPVGDRPQPGDPRIAAFAERHPWPREKPVVPAFPERNWLYAGTQALLRHSVPQTAKVIVELGSWAGRSTRFLADLAPNATVVAIDHWRGSLEHEQDLELRDLLPHLYEAFLAECWEYRERIIPLRAGSVEGLRAVFEAGLVPDAIYIDADHRYESVVADLTAALDLFPSAIIVGDDWDWEGVSRGVEAVLKPRGLRCEVLETAWRVAR